MNCLLCKKAIQKTKAQLRKCKNGRTFCSHSCSAIYNNSVKTHGTRVSKLERWLQNQLTSRYPFLEMDYNRKSAIDSELDISIPSLKIAFEINGIHHYKPIHGLKKFDKIRIMDDSKIQKCLERGITLYVIDTSSQIKFTEAASEEYLKFISDIIDNV